MTSRQSTILVLSDQPLVAALVGLLIELQGLVPAFARAGESAEDAIGRVRPLLTVLLDAGLSAATSDLFFARAAKSKVGVALFGSRASQPQLLKIAEARGIPWLEFPTTAAQFGEVLDRAAHTEWWRRGADRRAPRVQREPDGALTYLDRDGRRWRVYDRRVAERRREGSDGARRVFVSDVGESYEYLLRDDERVLRGEPSAFELERQLAAATKV